MKTYNQIYNKLEKIGDGAFGCVYKVNHIDDESRLFAMKKYYLDHVRND